MDAPQSQLALCTNYPRVKVEIDTSLPLVPGCALPRLHMAPALITSHYECLLRFFTLCGRISHTKNACPFPLDFRPLDNTFGDELRVEVSSVRRLSRPVALDANSSREVLVECSFASARSFIKYHFYEF